MKPGWEASAQGWLEYVGAKGDFGRRYVLDTPMEARVLLHKAATALDVGCGEGRFCRALQKLGTDCTGIDPTEALLEAARHVDPAGKYVSGTAEHLPFHSGSFDLVVSYLSLVDIADLDAAVGEMVRVLRPGGHILVANLQCYNTCWEVDTSEKRPDGSVRATMRDYLTERSVQTAWRNNNKNSISIINYHRPLERYMKAFLEHGFRLTHFAEPPAIGGYPVVRRRYNHAPWFHIMEWQKLEEAG